MFTPNSPTSSKKNLNRNSESSTNSNNSFPSSLTKLKPLKPPPQLDLQEVDRNDRSIRRTAPPSGSNSPPTSPKMSSSTSSHSNFSDSSWIYKDPLVVGEGSSSSLITLTDILKGEEGIRKDEEGGSGISGDLLDGSLFMSTDTFRRNGSTGSVGSGGGGSVGSVDAKRRVHFRDESSQEDIASLEDQEGRGSGGGERNSKSLVDIMYFDRLMNSKEPWEDPNFYAGFKEIFSADELWISDITCLTCQTDSTFEIISKAGKRLYYAEKFQGGCMPWYKFCCLRSCHRARNGFVVTLLTPAHSLLVKFTRKTECYAYYMDIVECFYSNDELYMGRIERTTRGYLIRDKENEDIYRVLDRPPKNAADYEEYNYVPFCGSKKRVLIIYRSDNQEIVGRLEYIKRGLCLQILSPCLRVPSCGLMFNPDTGVNAKILLLGALFFHLHPNGKYIDLPDRHPDIIHPRRPSPDFYDDDGEDSQEFDEYLPPGSILGEGGGSNEKLLSVDGATPNMTVPRESTYYVDKTLNK